MKLSIFSILFCCLSCSLFAQGDWEIAKDKNGIQVFNRDGATGNLKDFKAEAIYDCTVAEAEELIRNVAHYTEWIHNCIEAKVLKEIAPNEYLVYFVTDVPWPVSDRDIVIHTLIEHKDDGSVIFKLKGQPEAKALVKKNVRITDYWGTWELYPQADGKTKIVQMNHADPAGNIPAWMTNMAATSDPLNTFSNMRGQLEE